MNNLTLVKHFAKNQEEFKKGAEVLKKEARENGFKLTLIGLETFLDNCEIDGQADSFYRLCIPFAIEE